MLDKELKILQGFDPISLSQMDEVALLDRQDTKYLLKRNDFTRILEALQEEYFALEVVGKRRSHYRTLYFDSQDLLFYNLHQRGKKNRVKIRMRQYVDSSLTFLEIKLKNNKNRTVKFRKEIEGIHDTLSKDDLDFIDESYRLEEPLKASIMNDFHRITLVHKKKQERLTFDVDLDFENRKEEHRVLDDLVIAEMKQERFDRESRFAQLAKQLHIRPERVSKYCLGVALLIDDAKKNRIKEKLRRISKLSETLVV